MVKNILIGIFMVLGLSSNVNANEIATITQMWNMSYYAGVCNVHMLQQNRPGDYNLVYPFWEKYAADGGADYHWLTITCTRNTHEYYRYGKAFAQSGVPEDFLEVYKRGRVSGMCSIAKSQYLFSKEMPENSGYGSATVRYWFQGNIDKYTKELSETFKTCTENQVELDKLLKRWGAL